MDYAVCLCLSDPSMRDDIGTSKQLFYESFLQSTSTSILNYAMKRGASRCCALCALHESHERTRNAIRRYQSAASRKLERGQYHELSSERDDDFGESI